MAIKPNILKPAEFINPLLNREKISPKDFDNFTAALNELKKINKGAGEDYQKNEVREFLAKVFGYKTNTINSIDTAILENGNVEVIVEAKKLDNITEMITTEDIARKSFAEALKYFFDEREKGNHEIKHLIILNPFEWFIFDAKDIDKIFYQDKDFSEIYKIYADPAGLLNKTSDVYSEFVDLINSSKKMADLIDDIKINACYINLLEKHTKARLVALYKLLSPDTLLKKFNPNDANTLNRGFYNELLYIMGLEESKESGKKIIKESDSRHAGAIYNLIKAEDYDSNWEFEQILEVMIIWLNRLLFLKLLEGQLASYHGENQKQYKFMDVGHITDFDKLNSLFFKVLAIKEENRTYTEFQNIPYLNSSLFEVAEI